jgi:ribosomal protein L37AE/L43A
MSTTIINPQCPVCHSEGLIKPAKGFWVCRKCFYKTFADQFEVAGEASGSWGGREFDKDKYYATKQA